MIWTLDSLAALTSAQGIYVLTVATADITDIAGNALLAGASDSFLVDTTPPTVDVTDVMPDPRTAPVSQISFSFSELVVGLSDSDLRLTRNGGPNLLTAAQTLSTSDGLNWTLSNLAGLTSVPGRYAFSLPAFGSGIVDSVGNPLVVSGIELITIGAPGDMDFDGDVDFDDIDDFVLGLTNPVAYENLYGFPPSLHGDTDGDGDQDFDDISRFVGILVGGAVHSDGDSNVESAQAVDAIHEFVFALTSSAAYENVRGTSAAMRGDTDADGDQDFDDLCGFVAALLRRHGHRPRPTYLLSSPAQRTASTEEELTAVWSADHNWLEALRFKPDSLDRY
jgi:hypothetical protein